MNKNLLFKPLIRRKTKIKEKDDLINFVSFQFKQLAKKRLKIPIQLYNL